MSSLHSVLSARQGGKIVSHAGNLRIAKAFAELVHDSGFATAILVTLHLLNEVLAGQTGQRRNSRLLNRAALAAVAVGTHGGVGTLVEFFRLLSIRLINPSGQKKCEKKMANIAIYRLIFGF